MTDQEWKPWTLDGLRGVDPETIIQVKFSDGLLGMPGKLQEWASVQYAPMPITMFREWSVQGCHFF